MEKLDVEIRGDGERMGDSWYLSLIGSAVNSRHLASPLIG
jgi:hypothetical protein